MIYYVDGSCRGNGTKNSVGGFGVVSFDGENYIEGYSKMCENTTNNREELKAILYVCLKYGNEENPPLVYSDSAYSVNTLTNWMYSWARNGWKRSKNERIENLDLIQTYYNAEKSGRKIMLKKIKGHANVEGNEMADRLATGKVEPWKNENLT